MAKTGTSSSSVSWLEDSSRDPASSRPTRTLDKRFPDPRGTSGHILDADTSQTQVIAAAREGRSLVVQGPPGTGKSQTIANIIAAAVKDGKRVLFVAEKRAALDVVLRPPGEVRPRTALP